ncbi:MAG: hypothetical protein LAO77_15345 [Acidobacteriia bacterium]|nr:hypothetical protein [Terriglobia bacterium]
MKADRNDVSRIITLVIGSWLAGSAAASAATHCVAVGGKGGCFSSIQSAIAAANAGDTIKIRKGDYVENVIVDKPLTIAGDKDDRVVIRPAVSNPNPCAGSSLCDGTVSNIILVQADDVTLHDLVLDGDNPSLTSGIVRDGADLDARNGIITNHLVGTFTNLTVYDVTLRNVYLRGIYASSGGTFNFHHNRVENVQGDTQSIGMFNFGGAGVMAFNDVSRANDAVSSNWSTGVQFIGNRITESASGVHTDNSGGNDLIADNRVSRGNSLGTGAPSYGVWTFAAFAPITVRGNRVEDVDVGLATFGQALGLAVPAGTTFTDNVLIGRNAAGSVGAFVTTDQLGFGSNSIDATFTDNVVSGFSEGFLMQSDPGNTIIVRATCNDVRGHDRAAASMGAYQADLAGHQDISFQQNNLGNKGIGFANFAAGTIDAEKNWWGCSNGPGAHGCTSISGDVDAANFLERPSRCAVGRPSGW